MQGEITNAIESRILELQHYSPPSTAREDLSSFWEKTLLCFGSKPLNARREKVETPMHHVDAYKVIFEGFDDTPVYGWFLLPRFVREENVPCIVLFHGYKGSKGYPEEYGQYLLLGMAVFAIDVRGQPGETGNRMDNPFGMSRGWITQGILDKDTCYYKAITIDALKAVNWVSGEPEVDPERVCVAGGSQGGGLTLITAALSSKLAIAIADIPNMCHMDFGILHSTGSLSEAADFVSRFPEHMETVLETLSYFDILNLANRIRVPVMVSCGLQDTICMPETIYAAYNQIQSEKELHVYPFNGHFVGGFHQRKVLEFIGKHFNLG